MLKIFYSILVLIIFITNMRAQPTDSCSFYSTLKKEDSTQIRITRLKSNSDQSDFSPYFHQGQLYFVSGRFANAAVEYKDVNGNNEITDLYSVAMRDSVRTARAQPFAGKINSKYYEGPFTFSSDMQRMYYSVNDRKSAHLKIKEAEQLEGSWKPKEILPFCNDTFSYCHPTMANGQTKLWFSSNRSGGKGGMDLFYSEYKNGEWQTPVNAGETINTEANEVFPFVTDQFLYFSSRRESGLGGLDIYRVSFSDSVVTPELLPYPFNSPEDDFSIWTDAGGRQGYFASSRSKKSKDDIYHFASFLPNVKAAVTYTPKTKFCYTFYEENPEELQDSVIYEFEWSYGDGTKGKGIKTRHCYDKPGTYSVALNIVQTVSGEIFTSQAEYELTVDTPSAFNILVRDSARVGHCLDLSCNIQGLSGMALEEAYWDFGDGRFNLSRDVTHVYRKPGEYTVLVYGVARNKEQKKELVLKAEKKIKVNP